MAGQRKPAGEMHELLQSVAELIGLDDDERDSFIGSSMKRAGYKPRTQWEDGDGGGNGDDDFFSSRRRQQQQQPPRRVGGGGGGYSG